MKQISVGDDHIYVSIFQAKHRSRGGRSPPSGICPGHGFRRASSRPHGKNHDRRREEKTYCGQNIKWSAVLPGQPIAFVLSASATSSASTPTVLPAPSPPVLTAMFFSKFIVPAVALFSAATSVFSMPVQSNELAARCDCSGTDVYDTSKTVYDSTLEVIAKIGSFSWVSTLLVF